MEPLKVPASQETKLHFLDYWRIIRIRKTVILAVFLLVVITATLVTFILPESYSATARIKVERDSPDIQGITERMPAASYDPYFIQTEFETIKSERVLGKVIADQNLNDEWGNRYHGGTRLKNTSFIEIRVYSENKDEAARLANAIATNYQAFRTEQRMELSAGGIKAVKDQLDEQEKKVKKAQEEVERLREELKVPDAMAMETGPTALMSAESLRKMEALRIETNAELVRQKTVLDMLKGLKYEQLAQVLPTTVQDTLLSSLLEQRALAEQGLVVKLKEYGEQHAEVLKFKGQIADLENKIKVRGFVCHSVCVAS